MSPLKTNLAAKSINQKKAANDLPTKRETAPKSPPARSPTTGFCLRRPPPIRNINSPWAVHKATTPLPNNNKSKRKKMVTNLSVKYK